MRPRSTAESEPRRAASGALGLRISIPIPILIWALIWAGGAAPGAAQEVLTLERAVAVALEGSHRLAAADASLAAAEAGLDAARAARWPRLELAETYSRTTNPVQVFGGLLGQESFSEANFDPAFLNEPDPLDNFNTRVAASYPLWAGGRIAGAIAGAKAGREAADAGRERERQEVVREVMDAYSAAVLARHERAVAEEALATARAHVELVADLRRAGLVVESDLLQAEVRRSEIEEMAIRAESAVAVSAAALNLAMGRDLDTPFTLPEDLPLEDERPREDLAALTARALDSRPDLAAAAAGVEAAAAAVRSARAGHKPRVGLMGVYEANAEDSIGADGSNWGVMLGLTFTAFDGGATRARVRRAEAERRRAEELRRLAERGAALEVRRAWHELEAAAQRRELARRAVELARRSLSIVEDRYREGLTQWVELLDAETALTRARSREAAARRDLLLARATLDLAVGRL